MGKRKSGTVIRARPKEKLAITFDCPFCNHSKCVETKLDRKQAMGTLLCRVCSANYAMRISNLTEPIDVFCDWIDRCEEENAALYQTGGEVQEGEADYPGEEADEGEEYEEEPQKEEVSTKRRRLTSDKDGGASTSSTTADGKGAASPEHEQEGSDDGEQYEDEEEEGDDAAAGGGSSVPEGETYVTVEEEGSEAEEED